MDIYNFIENEEQREYLLNKHYEFTAVEAAYVVCNSNRAINEKHDAIDYIINMHIPLERNSQSAIAVRLSAPNGKVCSN